MATNNTDALLRKIEVLNQVIEKQVPMESVVLFPEYEMQPMRSIWSDNEMDDLKKKMMELIKKL